MIASTSRAKVTGSLSARYTSPPGSLRVLGLHRLGLPVQRGFERMPAQARAFHAGRELAHTREGAELAEALDVRIRAASRQHVVHLPEEPLGIRHRLALDALRQQRGRRDRDRAAAAVEGNVADASAVELHEDGELVAAEGIEAVGAPIGIRHLAEVARIAVVVDDDVAIQVLEVHQPSISRATCKAATRRSISSRVL
jgi:hypothetical protein